MKHSVLGFGILLVLSSSLLAADTVERSRCFLKDNAAGATASLLVQVFENTKDKTLSGTSTVKQNDGVIDTYNFATVAFTTGAIKQLEEGLQQYMNWVTERMGIASVATYVNVYFSREQDGSQHPFGLMEFQHSRHQTVKRVMQWGLTEVQECQ